MMRDRPMGNLRTRGAIMSVVVHSQPLRACHRWHATHQFAGVKTRQSGVNSDRTKIMLAIWAESRRTYPRAILPGPSQDLALGRTVRLIFVADRPAKHARRPEH